jgi:hypothetical protein
MTGAQLKWSTLFAAPLALTACNLDPRANEPLAVGISPQIDRAVEAARSCDVVAARSDPLDDNRSMLLIASNSSAKAKSCVLAWIRSHMPAAELTPQKRKMIGLD